MEMPKIGYGTWQRRGEECRKCVLAALETGYRHIDTAEGYGNETEVGQAIADSGVPRSELFLTTKVAMENLGPGQVRRHAEASLQRLGVDRVDLLLVHWPSKRYALPNYMAQMAEVQEAGLTRLIGVSNFTRAHLDAAVAAVGKGRIATNQCEMHVFLQNRLVAGHAAGLGIPMTAYCPLARGRVQGDPVLAGIAAAHGADEGQVALAFLMQQGHAVIPTSSNAGRIASNLGAKDITLTDAEMQRIRGLESGMRLIDGGWCPDWDV